MKLAGALIDRALGFLHGLDETLNPAEFFIPLAPNSAAFGHVDAFNGGTTVGRITGIGVQIALTIYGPGLFFCGTKAHRVLFVWNVVDDVATVGRVMLQAYRGEHIDFLDRLGLVASLVGLGTIERWIMCFVAGTPVLVGYEPNIADAAALPAREKDPAAELSTVAYASALAVLGLAVYGHRRRKMGKAVPSRESQASGRRQPPVARSALLDEVFSGQEDWQAVERPWCEEREDNMTTALLEDRRMDVPASAPVTAPMLTHEPATFESPALSDSSRATHHAPPATSSSLSFVAQTATFAVALLLQIATTFGSLAPSARKNARKDPSGQTLAAAAASFSPLAPNTSPLFPVYAAIETINVGRVIPASNPELSDEDRLAIVFEEKFLQIGPRPGCL